MIRILRRRIFNCGGRKQCAGRRVSVQQENGMQNKRVVILGGSSGIGLAVGHQAASQGAKVVIASSRAERVQSAVESIGGNADGHTLDLSDEQAIETLFTKLGAIDHL